MLGARCEPWPLDSSLSRISAIRTGCPISPSAAAIASARGRMLQLEPSAEYDATGQFRLSWMEPLSDWVEQSPGGSTWASDLRGELSTISANEASNFRSRVNWASIAGISDRT